MVSPAFPVAPFGRSQPLMNEADLSSRRRDAPLRLLLEGMQHVDRVCEADRVDSPVGVAHVGRDDFKDRTAPETR